MDHAEATRTKALSRYLMDELPAEEAVAFEEHFFDCAPCAAELQADEAFSHNLRAVFHDRARAALRPPVRPPVVPIRSRPERFWAGWSVPIGAVACLVLGLAIYQQAAVIPGLRRQVAVLSNPQSLFSIPLKIAREPGAITLPSDQPFFRPYFFLSSPASFPSYDCDVFSSAGVLIDRFPLVSPAPGEPFAFLLLRSKYSTGRYFVKIRGRNSDKIVATYTLDLTTN